jgi:hypothetical protein
MNLVIPVDIDGKQVYVHSTPISRAVFEQYYLVLSKVFSEVYRNGLDAAVGVRVAYLQLRSIAQTMGIWDGPQGVENGLMNEIRRLSNVFRPGPNGWEMVQLEDAFKEEYFTPDERGYIENSLVFFTAALHLHKRDQMQDIVAGLTSLWGISSTYLSCSEFQRSLPTLIKDVNGGEKAA